MPDVTEPSRELEGARVGQVFGGLIRDRLDLQSQLTVAMVEFSDKDIARVRDTDRSDDLFTLSYQAGL